MTITELKEKVENTDKIFAYMYCTYHSPHGKVIEIETKDLEYRLWPSKSNPRLQVPLFIYMWGWPGPDYNTYYFCDYGKTWAFTREELGNEID